MDMRLTVGQKELIALEKRLSSGDMTLGEIRAVEDTLLMQPVEKTKNLTKHLFEMIESARQALIDHQVAKLASLDDVTSKIQKFALERGSFSSFEIQASVEALGFEAELSEDSAIEAAAKKRLQHIEFQNRFGLVYELDAKSHYSTYATRLLKIAERVAQGDLEAFQMLSSVQQAEILAFAGRGQ